MILLDVVWMRTLGATLGNDSERCDEAETRLHYRQVERHGYPHDQ